MPTFGAKTVATLVKDVTTNESMATLDVTNNASFRMKPTDALRSLAEPLKKHMGIKSLILRQCELGDPECEILADILKENHVIEDLDLQQNKITSAGAMRLADGLAHNRGLRRLDLMSQSSSMFGEDCLEHFIDMYNTNVTLTKIVWRLDSRKAWALSKLMTRNVEIQKRQEAGKDFSDLLPTQLRAPSAAVGAASEPSTPAPALAESPASTPTPAASPAPASKEESPASPEPAPDKIRAILQADGKRWLVEGADGGDPVYVVGAERHHSVQILKCKGATVVIEGKVNSVSIDSCIQTQVVMDTVVSSVEVMNSSRVKFQVSGSCPSASVDKTDSCMIFLMSEEAKKMQISTSMHSDVQVTYMNGEDPQERPIPEQFVHSVQDDGSVLSKVSALYSDGDPTYTAAGAAELTDEGVATCGEEMGDADNASEACDPRAKLQDSGKRWVIENETGGEPICVRGHAKNHTLLILNCKKSTVTVDKKINCVCIDSCVDTQVVMDTVISAVEVVNCKKIKFQVSGACPSASVDKTNSCMVYLLSDQAKKMQISTSKHSDVQVTFMEGDESREKPIPEQFVHSVLPDGSIHSAVSPLYS